MVMKPGPFYEAVESLQAKAPIVLLSPRGKRFGPVSYTHLRAHETVLDLVCRLLLDNKPRADGASRSVE